MALKPDRHEVVTDVSYFMDEVASRGIVVIHDTAGSGAAMDQADAKVVSPSGGVSGSRPAGVLLNDVVNLDLTRQHLNQHQDEVQKGSKVTLLRKGWIVTDQVADSSPTVGEDVYYDTNGKFVMTNPEADGTPSSNFLYRNKVGRYMSVKDSDGYAKVWVDI
jgi:hypothetical protein